MNSFLETVKRVPEACHRVLCIDDDPVDAKLLHRALKHLPDFHVEFIHVQNSELAHQILLEDPTDFVFLDYFLAGETGLEILSFIREKGYEGPVIMVTGQDSQKTAADLISAGADDYIPKSDLNNSTLGRAIRKGQTEYARRRVEAQYHVLLRELREAKEVLETDNAALKEQKKMAQRFVDHVSHEFRTPLAVIKDFSLIIRDELLGDVNDEQREYLNTIATRVDDLTIMVDDMLDLSKIEAGMLGIQRRACEVEEIVKQVKRTLELKAAVTNVTLEFTLPPSLPTVFCDSEKASRTLINLAVNAIKFVGDSGKVKIWAKSDPQRGHVELGVTDNGPGITAEAKQFIFERFEQVGDMVSQENVKGFGLGLSIAQELVTMNLGQLHVESELGEGSTFSFHIPENDPLKIVEHFMTTTAIAIPDADALTLVHIDLDAEAGDFLSASSSADFLRHQIRRNDLLICFDDESWLLIAATSEAGIGEILQRVQVSRESFNKSRPGSPLPKINHQVLCSLPAGEVSQLMRVVQGIIQRKAAA
ncbi:MAG: hybrid sensor histidine kinase/response regulator [Candidatus Eisenbacteria bacterium]|uniref:histidine kinase n=1 Tax=Eiseniibacteriota bacterium TaxID=2212470 RepID=A0A7Y2H2D2_UNCEI|nr:hybrid sensor histidine kinase/response regulator [Candidatus Eisenbacteria bacterium]